MLDHVGIAVRDAERSRAFYDAALTPLGITLLMTVNAETSESGGTVYGIRQERPSLLLVR